MELQNETTQRIFAAADGLYEQGGRDAFPTVDAVRKSARVNMNDASTGMRLWRRAQKAPTATEVSAIPDGVQRASMVALAALWRDAQGVAQERFQLARAAWDTERAENEEAHRQLADAFEAQAAELRVANEEITRREAASVECAETSAKMAAELAATCTALRVSEVRADEIGVRAMELRNELDQVHREMARLHTDIGHREAAQAAELNTLRAASATAQRKADEALASALGEAREAREEAALLRGEIGALREQQAGLLPRPTTPRRR